jgi:hypothetical protein
MAETPASPSRHPFMPREDPPMTYSERKEDLEGRPFLHTRILGTEMYLTHDKKPILAYPDTMKLPLYGACREKVLQYELENGLIVPDGQGAQPEQPKPEAQTQGATSMAQSPFPPPAPFPVAAPPQAAPQQMPPPQQPPPQAFPAPAAITAPPPAAAVPGAPPPPQNFPPPSQFPTAGAMPQPQAQPAQPQQAAPKGRGRGKAAAAGVPPLPPAPQVQQQMPFPSAPPQMQPPFPQAQKAPFPQAPGQFPPAPFPQAQAMPPAAPAAPVQAAPAVDLAPVIKRLDDIGRMVDGLEKAHGALLTQLQDTRQIALMSLSVLHHMYARHPELGQLVTQELQQLPNFMNWLKQYLPK